MEVSNEKLFNRMIDFAAISLGVLLLPFGLFDWGIKSYKARKSAISSGTAKQNDSKLQLL